jgi:hypothetical protein
MSALPPVSTRCCFRCGDVNCHALDGSFAGGVVEFVEAEAVLITLVKSVIGGLLKTALPPTRQLLKAVVRTFKAK